MKIVSLVLSAIADLATLSPAEHANAYPRFGRQNNTPRRLPLRRLNHGKRSVQLTYQARSKIRTAHQQIHNAKLRAPGKPKLQG
ncbi:hypothetical protein LTS18_008905, partial [Coniosporium uncinatum]